MTAYRAILLTVLAMVAFAGNSLLCRAALKDTQIDAATLTTVRIVSGAIVLWLIVRMRDKSHAGGGTWLSAFWLFPYAAGFSLRTPADGRHGRAASPRAELPGDTMFGLPGLWKGERLAPLQWFQARGRDHGTRRSAFLPGASAPAPTGAALMIFAGRNLWGFYSLRGRGADG
jgi:hypothetical protein